MRKALILAFSASLGLFWPAADFCQGADLSPLYYAAQLGELIRTRRFAEAEVLAKKTLAAKEQALGAENPDLALYLNCLGYVYVAENKLREAEPLFKRSLASLEKSLDPNDEQLANARNNLILLYKKMGRYAEAKKIEDAFPQPPEKVAPKDQDRPLIDAVRRNDSRHVKYLLEEGAEINARDEFGGTALMVASGRGYLEVVRLLLEKGADLNLTTDSGGTALMWASTEGHPEVIRLLLEKGADANAKNRRGETALMQASGSGHTAAVEVLKAHGARE